MINIEHVYKFLPILSSRYLLSFEKLYDKFNDKEKKQFLASFIDEVWLYEKQQESGQILRKIRFKFPVFYNGQDTDEIGWDKNGSVETVVLMSKVNTPKA